MYAFRGYSLPMEVARQLLDHCWRACTESGLDVVTASSDGEFIQLIVRGKQGQPLTLSQLSKDVWKEVCKYSKTELIKKISSLNKTYIVTQKMRYSITLEGTDMGDRMKTPVNGWHKKNSQQKQVVYQELSDCDKESEVFETENEETADCDDTITYDYESVITADCDDTITYDYESVIESGECLPRSITYDEARDILTLLKEKDKWNNKTIEYVFQMLKTELQKFTKSELITISKYLNLKLIGTKHEIKTSGKNKKDIVESVKKVWKLESEAIELKQKKRTPKIRNPKRLQVMATDVLKKTTYPKQVLNIAYATYIWPDRVKTWKRSSRVSDEVDVVLGSDSIQYKPYYVPEFDDENNSFRLFTYDKTHLGTNMRKFLCLDKVQGISLTAWKIVSEERPDLLHPSLIEVTEEGKILDQMKESLARSMLTNEIENEMALRGFHAEAEFCHVFREGLYEADDTPGISAIARSRKRLALMEWLDRNIDFGKFPPYGGYIKGISNVLYEGLRTSQEAKLLLYPLTKAGTYCVRAANTLCSESFFGSMQEMDPWGQGILSGEGVKKHLNDFTTVTAMKMIDNRNIYIKTKKDTVYPQPKCPDRPLDSSFSLGEMEEIRECICRDDKFIKCIIPKNHFFDTKERARVRKEHKPYRPSASSTDLRGEQAIRKQYGYTINEARILPSKRLAVNLEEKDN